MTGAIYVFAVKHRSFRPEKNDLILRGACAERNKEILRCAQNDINKGLIMIKQRAYNKKAKNLK
jgi:hypothetical protein